MEKSRLITFFFLVVGLGCLFTGILQEDKTSALLVGGVGILLLLTGLYQVGS